MCPWTAVLTTSLGHLHRPGILDTLSKLVFGSRAVDTESVNVCLRKQTS